MRPFGIRAGPPHLGIALQTGEGCGAQPESATDTNHRKTMLLQPAGRDGRRFLNPVPTEIGKLSVMFKVLPQFLFGAKARSPREPLGPFHTDAKIYATEPQSGLRITWMGHSTSIVEIDGVRILIDPVWDERASPTRWSGPKRFFPAPLALSELPPIDAVIVSHDHYDHLGEKTVRAIAQLAAVKQTQWIVPLGVAAVVGSSAWRQSVAPS